MTAVMFSDEETCLITFGRRENETDQVDMLAMQDFCLKRGEILAAEGMYGLPSRGAGTADARE